MRVRLIAVAGCASLALGIAACGSSNNNSSSSSGGGGSSSGSSGGTVDIYSSLPLQGASKDQTGAMVQGIRLALEQAGGKAGNLKVNYQSLDDSTAQMGNWDPAQTGQNARKVAQDSKAVYYIGEFNSGASQISMPDAEQRRHPAGVARQHVRRIDDERGGQRPGRAARSTSRRASAPTCASSPGTRSRPPHCSP